MKVIAWKIMNAVDEHAAMISEMNDEVFSEKPAGKWSRKEILGHLVDSAQNNIQRFVRGQYEDKPTIVYSQNDWVALAHYSDYDKEQLIRLWVSLNRHLCRILMTMDTANYEKECNSGKTTVELHPLSFFAEDYLRHLHHHLDQIGKQIGTH